MAIKKDIKYVIRDFINVSGGGIRLKEGENFKDFLKNKRHVKKNSENDRRVGSGETDTVGKGEEGNKES